MRVPFGLRSARSEREACPACAVDFVPRLTDGRCPICGWIVLEGAPLPRRTGHPRLARVGLVWVLGIVVFLVLAHALYT
jgi:hypothetical protein